MSRFERQHGGHVMIRLRGRKPPVVRADDDDWDVTFASLDNAAHDAGMTFDGLVKWLLAQPVDQPLKADGAARDARPSHRHVANQR